MKQPLRLEAEALAFECPRKMGAEKSEATPETAAVLAPQLNNSTILSPLTAT